MTRKTILCFGDSNTYGAISSPVVLDHSEDRFDPHTRWTGVLRDDLPECDIIEEGLCGRSSAFAPTDDPCKNGEPYLLPCLLTHRPISLVVLMLGSNDIKREFHPTPAMLREGLARLVGIVRGCAACGEGRVPPKILLLSPAPMIRPEGRQDFYDARGREDGVRLMLQMPAIYGALARDTGCAFLDAAAYGGVSPKDGLHMTAETHIALGHAVAAKARELLG